MATNNQPINYKYSIKAWWLYLWYKPIYIEVNKDNQHSEWLFENKIEHRYYCSKRLLPWIIVSMIISPLIILYGGIVQLHQSINDIRELDYQWLEGKSSRLDLNGRLTAIILLKGSSRPYNNK